MAGPTSSPQKVSAGTSAASEKDQTTTHGKPDDMSCDDLHTAINRRYDPFVGYILNKIVDASVPPCVPKQDSADKGEKR